MTPVSRSATNWVSVCNRLALLVLLLLGGARAQSTSSTIIAEPEPVLHDGLYATFGVGVVDVDAGSGVDVPLGFTLFASRIRAMLTVSALDLGLLQRKEEGNSRYLRIFDTRTRTDFCVDSSNGQITSYNRCSGDTDVLRSMSVDLNFLPVTELYVADRLGAVHVGLGARAFKPRTLYGTLGMFFPSESGRAIGAQLSMGREYIFLGMKWGLDIRRISKWL